MLTDATKLNLSELYQAASAKSPYKQRRRKIITPDNPMKFLDWRNAFMRSRLTRKQKECLLAISKYMDYKSSSGRISMGRIAQELGINERNARRLVDRIHQAGWVEACRFIKKSGMQGCNIYTATVPIYPVVNRRSLGAMVVGIGRKQITRVVDSEYAALFDPNYTQTRRQIRMSKLAIPKRLRQKSPTPHDQDDQNRPPYSISVNNSFSVNLNPPISPLQGDGDSEQKDFSKKETETDTQTETVSVAQTVADKVAQEHQSRADKKLEEATKLTTDMVLAAWKKGWLAGIPDEEGYMPAFVSPKVGHLHAWVKHTKRFHMTPKEAVEFTEWVSRSWIGLCETSYRRMRLPYLPSLAIACGLIDSLHNKFALPAQFYHKVAARNAGHNEFEKYKYNLMAQGVPEDKAIELADRKYASQNYARDASIAHVRQRRLADDITKQMTEVVQAHKALKAMADKYRAGAWFGNPYQIQKDLQDICDIVDAVNEEALKEATAELVDYAHSAPLPPEPVKPTQTPAQSATIPTGHQIPLGSNGKPLYEPHETWYIGMSEAEILADRKACEERDRKADAFIKEMKNTKFEDKDW